MKMNKKVKHALPAGSILLSALLVLTFLVVAQPQTAQAATCQAYYTVHKGDTTPYISQTFGFKWKDIAAANDMDPWEKLTVGQRLCIPPADKSTKNTSTSSEKSGVKVKQPADESKAKFLVNISAGRIYASLSKFSEEHVYLAKARDVYTGIGGWYNLGYITIDKKSNQSFSWAVPSDLKSTSPLSVCFKDQSTDELICRSAINP
jgi:LysM repeat protein